MFGTKKRIINEQRQAIETLSQRLAAAEADRDLAQETLRGKELAISKALTDASFAAQRIVDDASGKAAQIQGQAEESLQETKRETEILIEMAYQNARDIVKEAEQHQQKRREDTERTVREYGELLHQYNDVMRQSAAQAEAFSLQYAGVLRKMISIVPELTSVTESVSLYAVGNDVSAYDNDSADCTASVASGDESVSSAEDVAPVDSAVGAGSTDSSEYPAEPAESVVEPEPNPLSVLEPSPVDEPLPVDEALSEENVSAQPPQTPPPDAAPTMSLDEIAEVLHVFGVDMPPPDEDDEHADEGGQVWKVSDVAPEESEDLKLDAIINSIVNRGDDEST